MSAVTRKHAYRGQYVTVTVRGCEAPVTGTIIAWGPQLFRLNVPALGKGRYVELSSCMVERVVEAVR
jgi:hypothetical protein